MSINKYATTFTKNMKLVPHLVATKLPKVNKFTIGLPADYGPTMKLETTLKAAIKATRNVETHIEETGLGRAGT